MYIGVHINCEKLFELEQTKSLKYWIITNIVYYDLRFTYWKNYKIYSRLCNFHLDARVLIYWSRKTERNAETCTVRGCYVVHRVETNYNAFHEQRWRNIVRSKRSQGKDGTLSAPKSKVFCVLLPLKVCFLTIRCINSVSIHSSR